MDKRDWRDAKIPQWVKDAVEAEMKADKLKLALAWPDEPRPVPAFNVTSENAFAPETFVGGVFYSPYQGWVTLKSTSRTVKLEWGKEECRAWGYYFHNRRDAKLDLLWSRCDRFAQELASIRHEIARSKKYKAS